MLDLRSAILVNWQKVTSSGARPDDYSSFSQAHNLGNNVNIGIRDFTTGKLEIPVKNVTPVRIELRTSDSKVTLLSELTY